MWQKLEHTLKNTVQNFENWLYFPSAINEDTANNAFQCIRSWLRWIEQPNFFHEIVVYQLLGLSQSSFEVLAEKWGSVQDVLVELEVLQS